MNANDFKKVRLEFTLGNLDRKIEIYTTQQGLTLNQYKELLKIYPQEEWDRLEQALNQV